MKIQSFIWVALISLLITFSCSNEPLDEITVMEMTSLEQASKKAVTVPFKAEFFTKRDYSYTPDCSAYGDYSSPNYQVGSGDGTHLGDFTVTISFCGPPGEFKYVGGEGTFVADNGDELYFNIPPTGEIGIIYQVFDDPYYELWFGDAFEITGGTGRFMGATGSGVTDSWVNLLEGGWANFPDGFIAEHQTDHIFTGEITFYPGSRSNKAGR
ncbi:hypothetical protein [Aegicerativicinus sediminis]